MPAGREESKVDSNFSHTDYCLLVVHKIWHCLVIGTTSTVYVVGAWDSMSRFSHLWQCVALLFAVLKGDDPAEFDDPLWEFTVDHTPSVHMEV